MNTYLTNHLMARIQNEINTLDEELRSEIVKQVYSIDNSSGEELLAVIDSSENLDQAFELLGKEAGAGATGENDKENGLSMFMNRAHEFKNSVCNNDLLQRYCNNRSTIDLVTAGSLVFGGLSASQTSGINIFLVANCIVRYGIRKFCNDFVEYKE